MSHVPRMRHRSKVQVEFFAMTKLNRACPASVSVDRRNCHEFGSVERFFNFVIPINLIHTFMITDELHSEQTLVAPEHRRYCMSALPPKADMCSALAMSALGQKRTLSNVYSINSSARPMRVLGTLMPSALAVLRLMMRSTFVAR